MNKEKEINSTSILPSNILESLDLFPGKLYQFNGTYRRIYLNNKMKYYKDNKYTLKKGEAFMLLSVDIFRSSEHRKKFCHPRWASLKKLVKKLEKDECKVTKIEFFERTHETFHSITLNEINKYMRKKIQPTPLGYFYVYYNNPTVCFKGKMRIISKDQIGWINISNLTKNNIKKQFVLLT